MRTERGNGRGAPNGKTGLRTTQKLVAAERDDIGARGDGLGDRLLAREAEARGVDEGAAAEVVDERDPALVREGTERPVLGPRDESGELEVARVDAEDRAGPFGDRGRVVADVGAIRRADLDQLRAGTAQHIGDAEASAD